MKKGMLLLSAAAAKTAMTKVMMLGNILLAVRLKGRQLHDRPGRWNAYFQRLSKSQASRFFAGIYLVSAGIASLLCGLFLRKKRVRCAGRITVGSYAAGAAASLARLKRKGEPYIAQKLQEAREQAQAGGESEDKGAENGEGNKDKGMENGEENEDKGVRNGEENGKGRCKKEEEKACPRESK